MILSPLLLSQPVFPNQNASPVIVGVHLISRAYSASAGLGRKTGMLVSRVKEKARPQIQISLDRDAYVDRVGMMTLTLGLVRRAKLAIGKTVLIENIVKNVVRPGYSPSTAHTRVPAHVLCVRMELLAEMVKPVT